MPTDLNQRAKAIVDLATRDEPLPDPDEGKDPAAVALGRKGGQKGGKARGETQSSGAIGKRASSGRSALESLVLLVNVQPGVRDGWRRYGKPTRSAYLYNRSS